MRAITINASGAKVDEPTLLANERAAARAKYGKLTSELSAWVAAASPGDRRWVWIWTDVSLTYPRREDLAATAEATSFRKQVEGALDTSVKPVREFVASLSGVELGDASGPMLRARLTAAEVKQVAALSRVAQLGVDLYPGTPASSPWGASSQWGATIRLPQAHTAYGLGSAS